MTREDAKKIIYTVINSGILDMELEKDLEMVANTICEDSFDKCDGSGYCDGCPHRKEL